MKRYLFALAVAVASVSAAAAQPPVIPGPPPTPVDPLRPVEPPRPPFPPARWHFHPTPGIFYYDSGEYLLGGVQGLARSTGMFTMQYPSGAAGYNGTGIYNGAAAPGSCATCGRRHWR